jgi:hypothetical protein
MIEFLKNDELWKPIGDTKNTCTICYGSPILSFSHISSILHRVNLNKMPWFWRQLSEIELYNYLHEKKLNKKNKKKN